MSPRTTRPKQTQMCTRCKEVKPHQIRHEKDRLPRPYPHCCDCRGELAARKKGTWSTEWKPMSQRPKTPPPAKAVLRGRRKPTKEKGCTSCHEVKPLEEYHKNHRAYDGRLPRCKVCVRERANGVREARREEVRNGLLTPPEEKVCGKCTELKPATQFTVNYNQPDTLSPHCKECVLDGRTSKSREQQRRSRLKIAHGMTLEQFDAILKVQGGTCDICRGTNWGGGAGGKWSNPVVDHCHEKGHIRGLLCSNCNTGLGMFGDSPVNLGDAVLYLLDKGAEMSYGERKALSDHLLKDAAPLR